MWMVIPPVLAGKTNDGLILNHNVGFLVLGFWCLVLRAWFFVLGAWFLVLGAWCLVLGSWCLVSWFLGAWFLVLGSSKVLIPKH